MAKAFGVCTVALLCEDDEAGNAAVPRTTRGKMHPSAHAAATFLTIYIAILPDPPTSASHFSPSTHPTNQSNH